MDPCDEFTGAPDKWCMKSRSTCSYGAFFLTSDSPDADPPDIPPDSINRGMDFSPLEARRDTPKTSPQHHQLGISSRTSPHQEADPLHVISALTGPETYPCC